MRGGTAHLINVALIGQLDHDLKLLHLDIQRIIVLAEEDLKHQEAVCCTLLIPTAAAEKGRQGETLVIGSAQRACHPSAADRLAHTVSLTVHSYAKGSHISCPVISIRKVWQVVNTP